MTKMSKATVMERLEHSPTLNTVLMVENVIKNIRNSIISIPEIKRALPKQINHNTLMIILEYLEESGKIAVTMKGITWIHNTNPNLKKAITRIPKIKDRGGDINNLEQIKSDISPILKSSGVSKAAIFGILVVAFLRFGLVLCIQVMPFIVTAIFPLSSRYSSIIISVL